MSVYRKHAGGISSGKSPLDNALWVSNSISEYNKFLNYDYDREYINYQRRIKAVFPEEFYKDPLDIAIIDDVFPHPLSAFRFEEFNSYLNIFKNSKCFTNGMTLHLLGNESIHELIANYKRKFPNRSQQIELFEFDTIIYAKLIYVIFLNNAYTHIDYIETLKIPFVFTLYPGGMFNLNNETSDMMLERVMSSPFFRKVIVTQKITLDYLIEKKFCTPDQIEFIYGGVVPINLVESESINKKHFGIDKDNLDICFVAAKYTSKGIDKGYDVFIDVAKKLSKKYNNIHFHVVGGFNEKDIDVKEINDRITFYGYKPTDWFDTFYQDKDIILSPNIPFKIISGSFDGFPTGSCVDAGLRKSAIFCTDELNLNSQFINNEDIVIIPHKSNQIVNIIEDYYRDPNKLKVVSENGYAKMKNIFSYDAQILPRKKILEEEIEKNKYSANPFKKRESIEDFSPINDILAKRDQDIMQELYEIKSSNAWHLVQILRRVRALVAPSGSRREKIARHLMKWVRSLSRFSKK